jgi:hypothetical protein
VAERSLVRNCSALAFQLLKPQRGGLQAPVYLNDQRTPSIASAASEPGR